MSFRQEQRADILILSPTGRLDSNSAPELEKALLEQLAVGVKRLVFDLAAMDYISSAGLRVILLAGKKLRAGQGRMVLTGMQPAVRDVFEMSGFLALFAVGASLDDGLAQV